MQQFGDQISGVKGPLAVIGPRRVEYRATHPLPVDAQFIQPDRTDKDASPLYRGADVEFVTKFITTPDPAGLPIPRAQQAGSECRGTAVRARTAFPIPITDSPRIPLIAAQRGTRVSDLRGLGRLHLPAVPQVRTCIGRHQHLVRRLQFVILRVARNPEKTGMRDIDYGRVDQVLAAQPIGRLNSCDAGLTGQK